MSSTATTGRTWRQIARGIIAPVIAANQGKSRKEQRKALREAFPRYGSATRGHAYKIWCEECAFALRERSRRSYVRHQVKRPEDVMQVMRPWAAERGLVEVTAVLDIDD
jgi:hypothetical protein